MLRCNRPDTCHPVKGYSERGTQIRAVLKGIEVLNGMKISRYKRESEGAKRGQTQRRILLSEFKPVLTAILPRLGSVRRWTSLSLTYGFQIHPAEVLVQQVNSKVWLARG